MRNLLPFLGLLVVVLTGCGERPQAGESLRKAQKVNQVESFLQDYWTRPLRAQGAPPAHFSPLKAALDPRSCGTCHVAQFNDWKQSLHSRAMGPRVLGQLVDTSSDAMDDHQDCLRCHAPLKEQADSLVTALAGGRGHGSRSSKHNVFASLTIKNTGTGHHFPIYVTPMTR